MRSCSEHGDNSNVCDDFGCFENNPKSKLSWPVFRLEIVCKTPSFGDKPLLQLAALLHGIANTMKYVSALDNDRPISTPVVDVNGVPCGTWTLENQDE